MKSHVFDVDKIKETALLGYPQHRFRCEVFLDTIQTVEDKKKYQALRKKAQENLQRWSKALAQQPEKKACTVEVLSGDWGVITGQLTKKHGQIFAVLNMANAYGAGGGVSEGMIAQEENMFRRSDCFASIREQDLDRSKPRQPHYNQAMTDLINGENGAVYLDLHAFRVCFKGPESKDKQGGYVLLKDEDIFPFYELRAAAIDGRYHAFDENLARQKIQAQLDTLKKNGIRCAILSAFGCGAFKNPAEVVARLYKEEIEKRKGDFDHLAFAIYYAGYGPSDNFDKFKQVFGAPTLASQPPLPSKVTIESFRNAFTLSIKSELFSKLKMWLSEMWALLSKPKKLPTIAEVKAYADKKPCSRTAHVYQILNSQISPELFQERYLGARKKKLFNNPFATTVSKELAKKKFDMKVIVDHALKNPGCLSGEIIKAYKP